MILLGPGSTVSHDALRLMARHGTALVAVGEDGVRCYTAPPLMPDTSDTARRQMRAWGDPHGSRITIARKMYALRLGEILPHQNLDALRGIEGARMKRTYQTLSQRYGITWRGRRYDRGNPLSADIPNQAINHASVAVTAAGSVRTQSASRVASSKRRRGAAHDLPALSIDVYLQEAAPHLAWLPDFLLPSMSASLQRTHWFALQRSPVPYRHRVARRPLASALQARISRSR